MNATCDVVDLAIPTTSHAVHCLSNCLTLSTLMEALHAGGGGA